LWQDVARALIEKKLRGLNLSSRPFSQAHQTLGDWLVGFERAIRRGSDPSAFQHILKLIFVRASDFKKWLRGGKRSVKRGPVQGVTGLQASDRKLFSEMGKRIKTGKARSARDAALQLFDEEKVSGNSRESAAKRVSSRYLKEYAT
jgi:hypothetical protein